MNCYIHSLILLYPIVLMTQVDCYVDPSTPLRFDDDFLQISPMRRRYDIQVGNRWLTTMLCTEGSGVARCCNTLVGSSDGSIGALKEPEFVASVSWCDRLVVAAKSWAWPAKAVGRSFGILAVPLNPRISCMCHVLACGRPLYLEVYWHKFVSVLN